MEKAIRVAQIVVLLAVLVVPGWGQVAMDGHISEDWCWGDPETCGEFYTVRVCTSDIERDANCTPRAEVERLINNYDQILKEKDIQAAIQTGRIKDLEALLALTDTHIETLTKSRDNWKELAGAPSKRGFLWWGEKVGYPLLVVTLGYLGAR